MRKKQALRAFLPSVLLGIALSAAHAGTESDQEHRLNQAFASGKTGAYRHAARVFGLGDGRVSPPGTTISNFYAGTSPAYRQAYLNGVVYGFTTTSISLGQYDLARCFQELAPRSGAALDAAIASGLVKGHFGVIPSVRRFCLPNAVLSEIMK